MSMDGWAAINWNWSNDANEYKSLNSLGCMTATNTGDNFSETLSTHPNMKDIAVRGQVTSSYPSLYSDSSTPSAAMSTQKYEHVYKVYMVGRGQGTNSIFGAYPLNSYKNGKDQGTIWQDGRRTPKSKD